MKNSLDTIFLRNRACSCQTAAMAGRQQSQGGHAAGAPEFSGLMQADTPIITMANQVAQLK